MNYTRKYDGKYIVKYETIGNEIIETYIEIISGAIFLRIYRCGELSSEAKLATI